MVEFFFLLSFFIQLAHSIEELATGFHKKWYLFRMPFINFLISEILFTTFWLIVLVSATFPFRTELQKFFLILMFANGVQHGIWWGHEKKYVPGLITAFLHVILFSIFYFKAV